MYITEDKLAGRQNNFDLLRLVAALFVFISHSYGISNYGLTEPLYQLTGSHYVFSTIGLNIFFIISGFLVCRSLVNSPSLKQYFLNRLLRIWPAFFICIVVCIFLGSYFTTLPVTTFLSHPDTALFFFKNSSLLSSTLTLPGVFNNEAVNASIWTIPVEVRLYLLLALLFFFTKLQFRRWLLFILIAVWIVRIFIPTNFWQQLLPYQRSSIYLGIYFLAGAGFYLYKDVLPLKTWCWILLLLLWLSSLIWLPKLLYITEFPFFLYSILWIAAGWKKIPFWKADISYGFYLFAFPAEKIVLVTAGSYLNFFEYFIITLGATIILALISWHVIEKKVLAYKYVRQHQLLSVRFSFSKSPKNKADSIK